MKWTICEKTEDEYLKHTAGIKARDDLENIMIENGIKPIFMSSSGNRRNQLCIIQKFFYHIKLAKNWKNKLKQVKPEDTIFIQFPIRNHSIFLSRVIKGLSARNVKTVLFLHDLEYMRHLKSKKISILRKTRIKLEELSLLRSSTKIVVHNSKMKQIMNRNLGIANEKMIELGIFDYLIGDDIHRTECKDGYSCIIAGNLDNCKSGYIYNLPDDVKFELYGPNYKAGNKDNLIYHGSYPPSELPRYLNGKFGLVWDGDSVNTCSGVYGDYLKVNNPHKTSLYLAAGIPVVVWSDAAIADFVIENRCGFVVDSICELSQKFTDLSETEYMEMKDNALEISKKIRNGYYTIQAINKCN